MECSPQRPPAKRMSTGVGDSMANAIDFLGRPRPPHWPENPRWDAAETAWGWLGTGQHGGTTACSILLRPRRNFLHAGAAGQGRF